MRQLTRKLTDWARSLSSPGRHHQRYLLLPRVPPQASRRTKPRVPVAPTVRAWYEPIDGASIALVRPYLTAYEHEETARLQRLGRETPWFAAYGVDLHSRDAHRRLEVA
ncbi:hypothetical protein ACH4TV_04610 [Streptomyces sp. NPDC020898]|uniref:hypothetical protein n=1 Tax=Streptomyces sp. NPDC020898 TaxID=3365101 RepID=UPI0037B7FEB8